MMENRISHTQMWDGKECELMTWGRFQHSLMDDSFPWIVENEKNGLMIVVTDWDIDDDGKWDSWDIAVKWDDLVNSFIEEEIIFDYEEAAERRALVIATLERTIERLKITAIQANKRLTDDDSEMARDSKSVS